MEKGKKTAIEGVCNIYLCALYAIVLLRNFLQMLGFFSVLEDSYTCDIILPWL